MAAPTQQRKGNANINTSIREMDMALQKQLRETHKKLKEQDKITIAMAPHYAPVFGRTMAVSLSGHTIYFPLDGQRREVPEDFAAVIEERKFRADALQMKQSRMADVQNNFERSIGEIQMF